MRIVSLLGSATEIVHALDLGDRLVGISHECDYPEAALGLPRVSRPRFDPSGLDSGEIDAAVRRAMEEYGSVYVVDEAMLARLEPDVVLTQAVCEVCAVPTGSVAEAVGRLPRSAEVISLDAHDLDGILATIEVVAEAAGEAARGRDLAERLRLRLREIEARVAGAFQPGVLLLEWLDPPFSPGHWVPEMIVRAGGRTLLGEAGRRSSRHAWEDLETIDPDVLLIEPCGYDLEAAARDADRHRDTLRSVARRAIDSERAWLLHSAWFSRSGPRVVEGVEVLGRILHPEALADVPIQGRARRWG